jgi:hypothetical protein
MASTLWTEATEVVRDDHSKHPQGHAIDCGRSGFLICIKPRIMDKLHDA